MSDVMLKMKDCKSKRHKTFYPLKALLSVPPTVSNKSPFPHRIYIFLKLRNEFLWFF